MVKKKVALIAHDKKKDELAQFVKEQREAFEQFDLIATKTTGSEIKKRTRLKIQYLHPDAGRAAQEMSLLISRKELDAVFFIRESISLYFHELDIEQVNRECDEFLIPVATNIETARAVLQALHLDGKEVETGKNNLELLDYLENFKAQLMSEIKGLIATPAAVVVESVPDLLNEEERLLREVAAYLYENQKVTAYVIRKQFNMGYNRAVRIMEELEQRQFIGPEDGKKPRQVLVTEEQYREFKGLA